MALWVSVLEVAWLFRGSTESSEFCHRFSQLFALNDPASYSLLPVNIRCVSAQPVVPCTEHRQSTISVLFLFSKLHGNRNGPLRVCVRVCVCVQHPAGDDPVSIPFEIMK